MINPPKLTLSINIVRAQALSYTIKKNASLPTHLIVRLKQAFFKECVKLPKKQHSVKIGAVL
jgi:hypothetical protein